MAELKPLNCDEFAVTVAELFAAYAGEPDVGESNAYRHAVDKMTRRYPELTEEQIADSVVAQQQSKQKKAPTELSKQLAAAKRGARMNRTTREAIDRAEKVLKGLPVEPKTPKQRAQLSKALNQLRSLRNTLNRDVAIQNRIRELERKIKEQDTATKPQMQGPKRENEARRDQLNKQLQGMRADDKRRAGIEKRIEELERKIAEGDLSTRPQKLGPKGERETKRDELNRELAELRAIEKTRQRLTDAIEDMREQLHSGNIREPETKARKKRPKDIEDLQFEVNALRAQIRQAINDMKPLTLTDRLLVPNHVSKMLMTTLDLSFIGRQGMNALLQGEFRLGARSFMEQFRAIGSDQALARVTQEILDRPNAALYRSSGLEIARHAEEFEGKGLKHIAKFTGAAYADRAFAAAGNRMRADLFDLFYESLGGNLNMAEATALSKFINDMTLRSSMDGRTARQLNQFFFSARAFKARMMWLTGMPIWKAPTRRMRIFFIKRYTRYLIGATAAFILAKMLGLTGSDDPRSSDFVKVKIGDTRLDPYAGVSQYLTFAWRLASGETVPTSGKNEGKAMALRGSEHKFGQRDTARVIWDFLSGKASPLASAGLELATGEEFGRAPTDVRRTVIKRVVPLSVQEIYDTIQHEGFTKGGALSVLALLGIGMQTHGDEFGEGEPLPNDIIELLGGTPKKR